MTPTAIDTSVSTAPLLSVTPPRRTAGVRADGGTEPLS
jgi:hypothetical protein